MEDGAENEDGSSRPRGAVNSIPERIELENPMKQIARFEQDVDRWWANRKPGEGTILRHDITEQEALEDLEHQVASFADFLKRIGRNVPKSLR